MEKAASSSCKQSTSHASKGGTRLQFGSIGGTVAKGLQGSWFES